MVSNLKQAVEKLEKAVSYLEGAVSLKLENDKRKQDIVLELEIMEDDRSRLAEQLEGTTHQLLKMQSILSEIDGRVDRALYQLDEVILSSQNNAESK